MHNFVAFEKYFDYFYQMAFFPPAPTPLSGALETAVTPLLDEAHARGVFSAAALIVASDGVASELYRGNIREWDSPHVRSTTPWPETDHETRFDLASVTKPLVAAALLAELDAHGHSPELRVGELLPEFDTVHRKHVSIAMLLGHTAGFPAEWTGRRNDATMSQFRAEHASMDEGAVHLYSCVGYIWAGLALEALAKRNLEEVLDARVFTPLAMTSTGYRPAASLLPHTAATEYQRGRGLVHGEVHDETSWALGGMTGNAGLFGTARDVAHFAEALRTGLAPDGTPAFSPAVLASLRTPTTMSAEFGYGQALGPRVGDSWSRALGAAALSHTGFTGTAFATVPNGGTSVVFFTNRVHPTRASAEIFHLRERVAEITATIKEQS